MTQPAASSSSSSQPMLRTKYKKERAFEPIYTGGAATALSPNGRYLFAPVNETIHITQVTSGKTVNRIPSDLEEISCLTLSHDGSLLLVASRSLAVRVIQIEYTREEAADEGEVDGGGVVATKEAVRWRQLRSIAKTHDAPVVVMQIDPTDTLLATGSSDGCAKVWDIRGGFCTHVFRNHGGIVSALAWNMPLPGTKGNDSTRGSSSLSAKQPERVVQLFTGSMDGKVRLWDLKASADQQNGPQRPVAVLEAHFSVVRGLGVNSDGNRLVSAGRDRLLAYWERVTSHGAFSKSGKGKLAASEWRLVDSATTGESMESASFLPDNQDTFWTAGAEGEIRLWSFDRKAITHVQPGGRFAKGTASKRKAVQSMEDEEEENDDDDETRAISQVHSLPLLDTLVSVHSDQNIVFRSVPNLHRTRRLVGFNDQIIDMALLSPAADVSDSHLAVATNTNAISIYALSTDEHSVELLPDEASSEEGHTGLVLCLDKSSDGKWLASGAKDRTVRIWAQLPKEKAADVVENDDSDGVGVKVSRGSLSESSNGVAATAEELRWQCIAVAEGHTESVGAVAFARRPAAPDAPGSPFLVSGSQDRTAKVWDLSALPSHIAKYSGKPLRLASLTTLKIHDKDINALDVSPNNALLLSGSQDKTAKVFSINYAAPSKANGHTAMASLKLVTTCRGHKRGVWSVAFSPHDAVFLTGSGDRSLKLWSINQDFSCIKTYIGHTNSILRVRFLKGSKGMQCISCASDGLVKVWNVKTEECLDTLDGHEDRVWGLECSKSGDVIISGAADSLVCFWRDVTAKVEEEKVVERQEEVEREQQFANLLAVKDYRNAISLALAMNQPRRLFSLFTAVDSSRATGDSTTSTGDLLHTALSSGMGAVHAKSKNSSSSSSNNNNNNNNNNIIINIDPSLQALVRAGVLSSSSATVSSMVKKGRKSDEAGGVGKSTSITGSSSVDQVIQTLHPSQLRTLLTFVRDWNTSSRTSSIAQTVLHAILRFHSADDIIAAYDGQRRRRGEDGRGGNENGGDDDDGAANTTTKDDGQQQQPKRRHQKHDDADLKEVVEAILPYTKRHYDRAQRLLTESAMLQYTLTCMDSVLGIDVEEQMEGHEQEGGTEGKKSNGDVLMNGLDESEEDEEMHSEASSE